MGVFQYEGTTRSNKKRERKRRLSFTTRPAYRPGQGVTEQNQAEATPYEFTMRKWCASSEQAFDMSDSILRSSNGGQLIKTLHEKDFFAFLSKKACGVGVYNWTIFSPLPCTVYFERNGLSYWRRQQKENRDKIKEREDQRKTRQEDNPLIKRQTGEIKTK
jgi:hypothetical protein